MYSHSQIFMVIGTVYLHIIDKEIILFILPTFLLKCDALSFSIFIDIEVEKEVFMHKMIELAHGLYPHPWSMIQNRLRIFTAHSSLYLARADK